jgi:hypothetical protein
MTDAVITGCDSPNNSGQGLFTEIVPVEGPLLVKEVLIEVLKILPGIGLGVNGLYSDIVDQVGNVENRPIIGTILRYEVSG